MNTAFSVSDEDGSNVEIFNRSDYQGNYTAARERAMERAKTLCRNQLVHEVGPEEDKYVVMVLGKRV